ncbi:MAG TPA: glycosyltransferase family 1 protein [Ktedonobacterales bacterium]|jgi:glycosyltransferase involved in cell wall biosynthesis
MGSDTVRVAINAQLLSFDDSYRNAGISRFISTLLEGLAALDSGQEYTAFMHPKEADRASDSPLARAAHLRLMGTAIWGADGPLRRIAWEQFALPGVLRTLGIDVFHAPANILPTRLPCPSVVTVHDLAFMRHPKLFRPSRRLYQRRFTARTVARATQVVAVSESTKRDVIELMRVPEERLHVIYPGIAADFQPVGDPEILARFRAKHGLPERYLLYLGTLEPRKNLLTLIEAYARLRGQVADAPPLVLAGAKGWYYQPLFARVRALGLERVVIFPGYVARDEQPLWYAGAEVFVFPSLYEGFGLPVAEALACGTPTITSNVSSLPEVAGDVAWQVDPRNAEALAHLLREILADGAARDRMARAGPAWASQFSIARMARAYAGIYHLAHTSARTV